MKLIVFDRDGTLNVDRDDHVKSADEWLPLQGALEALARLNHAGWRAVVATNQSGLARGLFDIAALNAMHAKMNRLLAKEGGRIDAVFYCPHGPQDGCCCRKPLPGLLEQIGERFGVDLSATPMVGDALRDLQAGAAAGCPTHLVRTGKSAGLDDAGVAALVAQVPGTEVHADLAAFAETLVQRERRRRGVGDDTDSGYGPFN